MTDPDNLVKFIEYCKSNYEAERNILIFWDHGGGSISGYGYDENHSSSSSMTLAMINNALKEANCKFDFIGFDACLMATLENALVCEGCADYLIASEETEPGTGWYYTNWLSDLSADTSIPTVDLAKRIIDDFVSTSAKATNTGVTLSVIDLAEMEYTVPETFRNFSSSTTELLTSDDYKKVSDARAGVRQFSPENKLNQVDLVDFAERLGTKEAKALAESLKGCIKYNRATLSRSNGVSIYFPYETTKNVKTALASYNDIGIDSEYSECIKSFASLGYGGQIAASASQSSTGSIGNIGSDLLGSLISSYTSSGSSTSPLGVLAGSFLGGSSSSSSSSAGLGLDASDVIGLLSAFSGRSMPEEYDWVDTDIIANNAEIIAKEYIDPSHITATEKNGTNVLKLTDKEWSMIQTLELNVFVDDGEGGYIDLGFDNTFDWDSDDDLLLEYDGTWLTLNGNVCAYYLVSDVQQADGTWVTTGRIPAVLNGQLVNLIVVFDSESPAGRITYASPVYADGTCDTIAKDSVEVKAGDKIKLVCDYYDKDGNYKASYELSKEFTVTTSGLTLTNLELDASAFKATYRLTDIYNNHYWIEIPE